MENSNQDMKLCPSCGTKNKAIYMFCNECGAPLNQTYYAGAENQGEGGTFHQNPYYNTNYNSQSNSGQTYYNGQFNQGGYTPYSPYGNSMNEPYYGSMDFNGVSAKDVYEFTGKKANLFYKLKEQHFSGRTGPYCWPLFILGFLLSFFGMGCWFLYHKMYKPAVGFFSAALFNLFLNFLAISSVLNNITDKQIKEMINSSDYLENYINEADLLTVGFVGAITSILELASFALMIILPFFAYKWYKNFALNKICEGYRKSPMPNIVASGGSAGGAVAVIVVSYVAIFLIAAACVIVPFTKKVYKAVLEDERDANPGYYKELPKDYHGEQLPFDEDDIYGHGEEMPFIEEAPSGEYW